jgi:hypothetical protein
MKEFPPMASRPKVRVTVSLDAEVLADFQRFARMADQSLSSFLNAWLADTSESAEFVAVRLFESRDDVRQGVAKLNASLQAVEEGFGQALRAGRGGPHAGRQAAGGSPPRPVIRGGNSPAAGGAKRGNRHD